MTGKYTIRVKNSRNTYQFELKRNITILRGDSGRGKTTLFDMIREYNRFGRNSGVSISSGKKLYALDGEQWETDLAAHAGEIIVIDEDSSFIKSRDFARAVRCSDNYYLLITRNYLAELPFSVDEIYELTGAKNKRFKRVYEEIDHMYDRPSLRYLPFVPEVIVTEDSGAGFQFFKDAADHLGIQCISANGKANIYQLLGLFQSENVVVIADGAAFGAEMEDVVSQQQLRPKKLAVFLPESFEWLILSSGILDVDRVKMESPELFADSADYMSWEQYFTDMLMKATRDKEYQKYKKNTLPAFYLQEKNAARIHHNIKGIQF